MATRDSEQREVGGRACLVPVAIAAPSVSSTPHGAIDIELSSPAVPDGATYANERRRRGQSCVWRALSGSFRRFRGRSVFEFFVEWGSGALIREHYRRHDSRYVRERVHVPGYRPRVMEQRHGVHAGNP